MCGRFSLGTPASVLAAQFDLFEAPAWTPRYNIAPTQEILVVVLTHLATFRGESAFRTWVWRVAANHLAGFRRGRRETVDFDLMARRLDTGLRPEGSRLPEAEASELGCDG